MYKFLFITVMLLTVSRASFAQEYAKANTKGVLTRDEMSKHWSNLAKDKGFSALDKTMKAKGFEKLEDERSTYGFEGEFTDGSGKKEVVKFYAYDYKNKNSKKGQGASVIWRQVGQRKYKAYIIFPEGEKDIQKALEKGEEWYADDNGKVQKAHSWGSCFLGCVKSSGTAPSLDLDIKNGRVLIGTKTYTISCQTQCFTGAIVCSGIATVIAVAGAAETGGVSVPFAIGVFATCAGMTCAPCVAMCGIGCM